LGHDAHALARERRRCTVLAPNSPFTPIHAGSSWLPIHACRKRCKSSLLLCSRSAQHEFAGTDALVAVKDIRLVRARIQCR
jgi:hypothetical protein